MKKYNLLQLLEDDKIKDCDFEDEKLASNLYYTSLSFSLREIDSIEKKLSKMRAVQGGSEKKRIDEQKEDLKEKKESNNWLIAHSISVRNIPAVQFDKMPSLCNVENAGSMDALLLKLSIDRCILIEFKNCSKSILTEKYLTGKDSILQKIKDSKNILNLLEIEGFPENMIAAKTELMVVYNKNDIVTESNPYMPSKRICDKDNRGKQSRATGYNRNKAGSACRYQFPVPGKNTPKKVQDLIAAFQRNVGKIGFGNSSIDKKHACVAFLAAEDLVCLIEDKMYFTPGDWGIYAGFFMNANED